MNYSTNRDINGVIVSRKPASVSELIYNRFLNLFIAEHNFNVKYGKPLQPLKEFQFDFLVSQRNDRKQRKIMLNKKAQAKW